MTKAVWKILRVRRGTAKDEPGTEAPPEYVLQELPDEIMKRYLGVLVWLVHVDDSQIDQGELREIHLLMTQRRCNADVRKAVREYLENPRSLVVEKLIDSVLKRGNAKRAVVTLQEAAPGEFADHEQRGNAEAVKTTLALKCALMKDAIRVRRATGGGPVREQPGVRKLAEILELDDERVQFIEEVCSRDDDILAGKLSDPQIAAAAKELAARAASVGVPVTAVYFAGSVTGLGAAGITSGLAALGLGGVLGLSAMVSGIGVAIILGGAAHKGVRWVLGGSERDRTSVRELMLQEVLRIHQGAIVNLGEDMSSVGKRIADLASEAETNRHAIDRLSRKVTLLSLSAGALDELGQRASGFERDLQGANGHAERLSDSR